MPRSATAATFTSIPLPQRYVPPRHSCRIPKSIHLVVDTRHLLLRTRAASSSSSAIPQDDASVDDKVSGVMNALEEGTLWEGIIKTRNRGGVIIEAGTRKAFCPYSLLDPIRLAQIDFTQTPFECTAILDKPIKCIVHNIDEGGRVVLSEVAYWMRRALNFYKPGDVTTCKVTAVQDYGAFVAVPSEDGLDHGVRGLIHVSELSWDVVSRPEDVVKIGDEVEAVVKNIKRFNNQIELSLRHEESDPLKESISSLLPLEGDVLQDMAWEPPQTLLRELTAIIDTLKAEPSIEDVQPTRQAEVQHKVSLDLELWLSKEEVENGFNLVAWSGRTLQEIHVTTDLTRDDMKSTLRKVLRRTM